MEFDLNIEVTNKENKYLFGKQGDSYYKGLVDALTSLDPMLTAKQKRSLYQDLQLQGTTTRDTHSNYTRRRGIYGIV
jgi:hypothetical protein